MKRKKKSGMVEAERVLKEVLVRMSAVNSVQIPHDHNQFLVSNRVLSLAKSTGWPIDVLALEKDCGK